MSSKTIGWAVVAAVISLFVLIILGSLFPEDIIPLNEEAGQISLGMIQVVALTLPAVAILFQAMLQYLHREEKRIENSDIGFDAEYFRQIVLAFSFFSILALTIGLMGLVSVLETPGALDTAILPVLFGMAIPLLMIGYIVWNRLSYE